MAGGPSSMPGFGADEEDVDLYGESDYNLGALTLILTTKLPA